MRRRKSLNLILSSILTIILLVSSFTSYAVTLDDKVLCDLESCMIDEHEHEGDKVNTEEVTEEEVSEEESSADMDVEDDVTPSEDSLEIEDITSEDAITESEVDPKFVYEKPTTDTFQDYFKDGYTLKNILTYYNIFSFNDAEAKHIVGPVIAKNSAYGTRNTYTGESSEKLIFADYVGYIKENEKTRSYIPSYIGTVTRMKNSNTPKFGLNYSYVNENPEFTFPNLYINDVNHKIYKTVNGTDMIYNIQDKVGGDYPTPNNTGKGITLETDNFINFDKAKEDILNECNNLIKKNDNILVSTGGEDGKYKIEESTGYLRLDAGKNYIIKDASRLRVVDIIYPDGYHPVTKPYPYNTVINIEGNNLPISGDKFEGKDGFEAMTLKHIKNEAYYYFPMVAVNGVGFSANVEGSISGSVDYGEDNSVVWNMPNIKTSNGGKRMTRLDRTDILGHMIAPNVEFWNLNENGGWHGSNNNGCAIVQSWHGGFMESHMWPYGEGEIGENIKPTGEFVLKGTKNIENADIKDYDGKFEFTLDFFDENSKKEGISNKEVIPHTIKHSNGNISFKAIKFEQEGVYTFRVKENIPDNKLEGIKYDLSEHKVVVDVKKVSPTSENFKVTHKITKVKDKDGNDINPEKEVSKVEFNNSKEEEVVIPLSFTIKKIDELTENILPGAVFDLYEADDNGKSKESPILKDITTGENGTIEVKDSDSLKLELDKLYVLVETKAPDGYAKGNNVIFYIKGTEGLFPNITDKVVIGNGGTLTITNKAFDQVLPETGGSGTENYLLLGGFMMLSSMIAFVSYKKEGERVDEEI